MNVCIAEFKVWPEIKESNYRVSLKCWLFLADMLTADQKGVDQMLIKVPKMLTQKSADQIWDKRMAMNGTVVFSAAIYKLYRTAMD